MLEAYEEKQLLKEEAKTTENTADGTNGTKGTGTKCPLTAEQQVLEEFELVSKFISSRDKKSLESLAKDGKPAQIMQNI